MRLVMEIENERELKDVEKFLKTIPVSSHRKVLPSKRRNIAALIAFANKYPLKTDKIEIPSREERNER